MKREQAPWPPLIWAIRVGNKQSRAFRRLFLQTRTQALSLLRAPPSPHSPVFRRDSQEHGP